MNTTELETDYLLNNESVIWLTEDIDSSTLQRITAQLSYLKNKSTYMPARIYCRSNGGDSRTGIAICNMIQRHGNQTQGWLVGDSGSTAATIWASCPKRFIMANSRLGIHPVTWGESYSKYDAATLSGLREEFDEMDRTQCRIYAAASNKDFAWWWQRYNEPGDVKWLNTRQLVELEMGELVPNTEPILSTDSGKPNGIPEKEDVK